MARVAVTIVTRNSRRYIRRCLETVFRQTHPPAEVIIVDNDSRDGTHAALAPFGNRVTLLQNPRNAGFAAAQNQAIAATDSKWVLTLNPDVLLAPEFVERLVAAGAVSHAGTVCGKLLRCGVNFDMFHEPRIDSTGLFFTSNFRHFDRGWDELDDGRFDRPEYVFGSTAAAALYRREMIDDISLADGFFDPDFFAYREDADVAWRAQLLGWRCMYTPEAVAWHVRRVVPGNRRAVPAVINMHSVKNRFLMRIKNVTPGLYRRNWFAATVRDLLVVAGCVFDEPASLPALWRVLRLLPRALNKRREIMRRRRVSDAYIAEWFAGGTSTECGSLRLPAADQVD